MVTPAPPHPRAPYERTVPRLASSGADAAHIERLERLGDAVGTAFQISDDIIDISSVSAQSGKTPGTDLREGVHTLPVLYAFREEGADADRLRELLAGPVTEDALVDEALELLERSPGMVKAKAKLGEYAVAAKAQLAELPQGPANEALVRLVDYTIERVTAEVARLRELAGGAPAWCTN